LFVALGHGGSSKIELSVILFTLFVMAQQPAAQRRAIVYTTAESTTFPVDGDRYA